jgi:signal transduction histidine kinase
MDALSHLAKFAPHSRRAFAVGVGLALAVLALTIFSGWILVRALVRQQIAQRDAEALNATTLMEQLDARGATTGPLESDEQIGFDAAILASRLEGVMGIRFFDTAGNFTDSFPATIQPQPLAHDALEAVLRFEPASRFRAATPLTDVFIYLPEFATGRVARVPTLEVTVPLHRRDEQKLAGAAQFIIEGQSIADEYARLDRHLGGLALLAFGVAGTLLVAMLWPAFRHVEQVNRQLAQRNERLIRANDELALAARASALGSVSAHLMHGLRNPLASLSQFVRNRGNTTPKPDADEWKDALTAARRMQSLVEQTLEVLADVHGGPAYELSARELADDVRKRVEPLARERGVRLELNAGAADKLSSHTANLVGLILVNLLENAIQATAVGARVALVLKRQTDHLEFRVEDEGGGFPEHLRRNLFLPCKSTREGGGGIGLAISKQLAEHLGASLELAASDSRGCVFALSLPLTAEAAGTSAAP